MKTLAALAAAALAFTAAANAADLPRKAPMVAPVAPAWNWTGVYVGIAGGAGWARSKQTDTFGDTSGDYHQSGGLIGGTLGFNWQIASFVLGAEGDWSWARINGSLSTPVCGGGTCFTNLRSFGTARGRIGYAFDRWLVYATGGLAWADIKAGQSNCPAGVNICGTKTRTGWTVGGGVEAFVVPHWTAKAEYLYADFGDREQYIPAIPVNVEERVSIFRVGVNYHF